MVGGSEGTLDGNDVDDDDIADDDGDLTVESSVTTVGQDD